MRKAYFVVKETKTGKEVRRIDVTKHGISSRDKIERGLLHNMDTDNFYVEYEER